MIYLLDTSAIIGLLERKDSSLSTLFGVGDSAAYHPVTLGELHAGIEAASSDAELDMRINTLDFTVQRLQVIDGNVLPAEQFGFLTARFSRKLSQNDYWIVASAVAFGAMTLVSEDTRLFGLVTSDPFAEALRERAWVRPSCRLVESTPVLSPQT